MKLAGCILQLFLFGHSTTHELSQLCWNSLRAPCKIQYLVTSSTFTQNETFTFCSLRSNVAL